MPKSDDYFICSHCGEKVPASSKICKSCGSEDTTGWSEDADPFASFPPESFDYEESLEQEFGGVNEKPKYPSWLAITGFVILFLFVYAMIR